MVFYNTSLKFLAKVRGWRGTVVLMEEILFWAPFRALRIEVYLFGQLSGTTSAVGPRIIPRPQVTCIRLLTTFEPVFLP